MAIARAEAAAGTAAEAQDALDQALAIARGVGDSPEQGQMLVEIAIAARQLSDADQPLERIISVANGLTQSIVGIAQAAGQLSNPQSAQAVLEKATAAAETIDYAYDRSSALRAILEVQESIGVSETLLDSLPHSPAELKDFLDNALTDVANNPQRSNASRHQALLEIIQALQQCPDAASAKALLDRALPLAHALTLPEFRDPVLAALAVAYGHITRWENALQTLEACDDDEKTTEALTDVLGLWVEQHKLDLDERQSTIAQDFEEEASHEH